MRAAEWVGYQLATHPKLRRVGLLWAIVQVLVIWAGFDAARAVAEGGDKDAPPIMASTLTGVLNWTGITDSHGIPPGDLFLSTVSTSEAIAETGPSVDWKNPVSWVKWLGHATTTGLSHDAIMQVLRFEAATIILMVTVAVWLLGFAVSFVFIRWLAIWLRPFFTVIQNMLNEYLIIPICITTGLVVGGWYILWHGRRGQGMGMMLSALAFGALALVLTTRSLSEFYRENGPLDKVRNLAFEGAQAFANNGGIRPAAGDPWTLAHSGRGAIAQVHALQSLIIDSTVRPLIQLLNFGTTIDQIPACEQAYNAAIMSRVADAPAHAMKTCGMPQALAFAQRLGGEDAALGLFFIALASIFVALFCYIVYSLIMVGTAFFVTAAYALISSPKASIPGDPRESAKHRGKSVLRHLAMVGAYILYACGAAVAVYKMAVRGGWSDQVGMVHPVAKLLMLTLISAVAIGVFWWLKRELKDRTFRTVAGGFRSGYRGMKGGYAQGQKTYEGGRKLSRRLRNQPEDGKETDATKDDRAPLTGRPASGRPPGGRPPTAPRGRRPPTGPSPTAGGGVSQAAGRGAATGATGTAARAGATAGAGVATAGATVVGAAVASKVVQRQRNPGRRPGPDAQTRTDHTRPPVTPPPESPPQPVSGREGRTKPPGPPAQRSESNVDSRRTNHPPRNHTQDRPDAGRPVKGRDQ